MRAEAVLIELSVYLVKAFLRHFLMAEHLDDLLAVHHLLDISLGASERFLLTDKVFCRTSADLLRHKYHRKHAYSNDKRHPYAVPQHYKQYRNNYYT